MICDCNLILNQHFKVGFYQKYVTSIVMVTTYKLLNYTRHCQYFSSGANLSTLFWASNWIKLWDLPFDLAKLSDLHTQLVTRVFLILFTLFLLYTLSWCLNHSGPMSVLLVPFTYQKFHTGWQEPKKLINPISLSTRSSWHLIVKQQVYTNKREMV